MELAGYKIKVQTTGQHLRVGPSLEPLVMCGKGIDESCSVCHDTTAAAASNTGGYRFTRNHARGRKILERFASWAYAVCLPDHMNVAEVAAAFIWHPLGKIYHRNKISINQ